MLLGLRGSPREDCGLGLRPANGSGALAALWDREGLPTTGSVGPLLLRTKNGDIEICVNAHFTSGAETGRRDVKSCIVSP